MNVTKSSEWKWVVGMSTTDEIIVLSIGGDGWVDTLWGECSHEEQETWEPDLEDPSTQGAIVFGIFEPLGIEIYARREPDIFWAVQNDNTFATAKTRPELIKAVFAALDSKVDE